MPNKKSSKSVKKSSALGRQTASSAYAKRPLWHWVVLYLIIGGILYLMVYYFLLKGHNSYSGGNYQMQQQYSYP